MVFSSLLFIFKFLPITLLLYYIVPKSLRNIVLILASLIFYAWGEPVYIVIMLFAIVFDYTNGLIIEKNSANIVIKRLGLIASLVVNLGLLSFFKYYGFFVSNVSALFHLNLTIKSLPLPLGISFYTFQSMSYIIDVYLGKVPAQKKILAYATFVTMFPQLVAGPIVRYIDISKQIDNRKQNLVQFLDGLELFIIGLAKKVLLANNIGILWTSIKATPQGEISILTAWIGIISFTFQIYFDFSGYSDMAIGLAKMLGFELNINFNYPYISRTVTEFWRRWHISLGTWFREYLYIPLGGNRQGKWKQLRNLFVVWFLTGFWHGANWNFIVWGLYFGSFVVLEKFFLLKWLNNKPRFIGHVYTLLVVIVGWVFFEFDSLTQGLGFIRTMFGIGANKLIDGHSLYYLYTNAILFVILAICSTPLMRNLLNKFKKTMKVTGTIAIPIAYMLIVVLCTAYLVNESYNPFLYFRF
ncbi:MBOAT family O-acyltransferase [Desulfosporosinus sp. FKA]|uniref:MBOAT family O-acyltransferase n=1 Tax=Desulfosporosinus sp. FKA TaxID=1969834 RepID=UPI000B49DE9F|nr:MBOAT family O-acyltransferase [Desulfosporosinus sp. FKA]